MSTLIISLLEDIANRFGDEAPITLAVAALAEQEDMLGTELTYAYMQALASFEENSEDEEPDEPFDCDLEDGFDPYEGCYTWDC